MMKSKFFETHLRPIIFGFFLLLSLIKMRHFIFEGRLWAEEGRDFYSNIAGMGWPSGLFFVFNGHLEWVTNGVVFLSTLVPFEISPLVTTYSSLLIQSVPILLLAFYRDRLKLTSWQTYLWVLIAAGVPQAPEVWANSINLHFHFTLLVGLLALFPIDSHFPKWGARLALFLAGISGIPPNFFAPIFGLIALKSRNKERWIQFIILCLTSLIQCAVLFRNHFESGDRQLFSTPATLWLAPLSQVFLSPLLGFRVASWVTGSLRTACDGDLRGYGLGLFLSSGPFWLIYFAIKKKNSTAITAIFSALYIAVLSTLLSLGDKKGLISTDGGGRYYYASILLLWIGVFSILNDLPKLVRHGLVALIALVSISNFPRTSSGPAWRQSLALARLQSSSTVPIWPQGWEMPLK